MTESIPTPRRETYAEGSRRAYEATPLLDWPAFLNRFDWEQGQHVSLIGPTGFGKTTLATHLLENPPHGRIKPHSSHWYWRERKPQLEEYDAPRPYVVVLATKPRDEVVQSLANRGYIVMREWQEITPKFHPDVYPRRILWPSAVGLGAGPKQRKVIYPAFQKIFAEEGWVIFIDEVGYVTDPEMLQLRAEYRDFLLRARSSGVSVISAVQRPAWVPREMYSQVRHVFFWRTNDESDLDRIQGVGGLSGRQIRAIVVNLDLYETCYVNTLDQYICRTQTPPPS